MRAGLDGQMRDIVDARNANASRAGAITLNTPRASVGSGNATRGAPERTRTSFACNPGDSARRIVLGQATRTEDNVVAVPVNGDFLQLYPRMIIGRTWRAWRGQCSAPVPVTGAQTMQCDVENVTDAAAHDIAEREKLSAQYVVAPAGGDSIRFRVIALGEGKWQTDTMFGTAPPPPRLIDRALVDSGAVCQGRQAFSPQSVAGRHVLVSGNMQGFITMLRVTSDTAPRRYAGTTECPIATMPRAPFTAFVLGDVGSQSAQPITLCYIGCTERHTVDPARHMLSERAALTFRPANLREDNGQYEFELRIDVDSAPAGLTPLVVFYFDRRWRTAHVPRSFGVNAWVLRIGTDTGGGRNSPADAEVRVYFLRR